MAYLNPPGVWLQQLNWPNFLYRRLCPRSERTAHEDEAYGVWQKSNETDFVLTMNFILFTNQGYPLQNSSLGQLHSDGGVVSIVRISTGRLLLVYLSACRLHSSGNYPEYQNGALSSGF